MSLGLVFMNTTIPGIQLVANLYNHFVYLRGSGEKPITNVPKIMSYLSSVSILSPNFCKFVMKKGYLVFGSASLSMRSRGDFNIDYYLFQIV